MKSLVIAALALGLAACSTVRPDFAGQLQGPVPPEEVLELAQLTSVPVVPQARQATPAIDLAMYGPDTIVVSTRERRLYHTDDAGVTRVYRVGVGRPGFTWGKTTKISAKKEWPEWTPPEEMRAREFMENGRLLPARMEGGPDNPLGARALYLGSTLYRIHGTNNLASIGRAESSGCFRMMNNDVIDLYRRVRVGTKVVVLN